MKKPHRKFRLLAISIISSLITIMCSGSYITPDILTATAQAAQAENTALPTAFFISASETATNIPTETNTPDPLAPTLTPEIVFETPTLEPTPLPTATLLDASGPPYLYTAQSGDTVATLAKRFGVSEREIFSPDPIPEKKLIEPGQILMIPWRMGQTTPEDSVLPDSEIVYSSSVSNFDAITYVNTIGGHLSKYREYLGSRGWMSGAEIVQRVAIENSINPRILLALLEYQGHWVLGKPQNLSETDYPMGYVDSQSDGLFAQLIWAVNQLSTGYYGWRAGTVVELRSSSESSTRIAPQLNAGSVAIQYFFHQLYEGEEWAQIVSPEGNFVSLYNTMFGGDPWVRAAQVEPLFPPGLTQPSMILP
ncbi:MAG: LysM peptidoglycan-binding domain-containing protein, partial [Chloroflexota bacterium]